MCPSCRLGDSLRNPPSAVVYRGCKLGYPGLVYAGCRGSSSSRRAQLCGLFPHTEIYDKNVMGFHILVHMQLSFSPWQRAVMNQVKFLTGGMDYSAARSLCPDTPTFSGSGRPTMCGWGWLAKGEQGDPPRKHFRKQVSYRINRNRAPSKATNPLLGRLNFWVFLRYLHR